MNILIFTKDLEEYSPFIGKVLQFAGDVRIIYTDDHPKKKDISWPSFLQSCKNFSPDLIISFYYNKIIQDEILAIANLAVNFHGSLLPNYAGAHALNWQIINGEKQSGVTIHELTSTVDGGRIISQDSFRIEFNDTANDVLKKGIFCATKMLEGFFEDYKCGMIRMYQQVPDGTEFSCTKRKVEDGEITKDMDHVSAYNMIRALVDPWPGAFYYDEEGRKIVIKEYLTLDEVKELM